MNGKLERLAAAGFHLLPLAELPRHYVLARGEFVALVERTAAGGFGRIGSAGQLTGSGYAALTWRAGRPWFVARGYEREATAGQVAGLREFALDLERALG